MPCAQILVAQVLVRTGCLLPAGVRSTPPGGTAAQAVCRVHRPCGPECPSCSRAGCSCPETGCGSAGSCKSAGGLRSPCPVVQWGQAHVRCLGDEWSHDSIQLFRTASVVGEQELVMRPENWRVGRGLQTPCGNLFSSDLIHSAGRL